jgi:FAD/FMN-containing dehydrogenase
MHSVVFKILEEQLTTSTVFSPGSKAYTDAKFIGNLLYQS